ncbi:DUF4783 domain-containing protein [Mucilaginibacter limnophilus]|uniref:DUF4783 domain-containing protein n=1 Tax=Mucilaginibacter limnophilus TaxID=1932778 RepID=A0A3S2WX08_9SPHI|nr:DUF4783 domain-containing protein [Mucilaginibacter limnophilus]RVT99931.1 DUF4783 domain-containing protein [Mucilaginibacter limnophilus]
MTKRRFLPVLILFMLPLLTTAAEIDVIADLFKSGNSAELSKHFAQSLDVTLLKEENVYSKTQAELVLKKFFEQNKPKAVKVLHRVNTSNTYRFGVLLLSTDKGNYRVSLTMNSIKGSLQIIELRIEAEKP